MKQDVAALLATAGVELDGGREFDMQVNNDNLYQRIMEDPSMGGGEAYVDGWWDCGRLDELFFRVLRHVDGINIYGKWRVVKLILRNVLRNQQNKLRSKKVAEQHYNIGNDLYEKMLGPSMAYTCAYWKDANSLDQAQYNKYDLICRKVNIQPGEHILELGCGWGGFSKYAAEHYDCRATAVNISTEQMKFARERLGDLPVEYITSDYRDVERYNPDGTKFDKIVSIGMCEHVGFKNYRKLMKIARAQLKDEGLFLLHTIGKNHSLNFSDPWIEKYIFPNSILPSLKRLSRAFERIFVLEDMHNIGADYDKTLMAWEKNFEAAWPALKDKYGERFRRMWRYYLLACAGAFRARQMQLWQFVFSPQGQLNGYNSLR